MSKHVAIIHPEGNFNNNPHLSSVIEVLCEKGYQVDIYVDRQEFAQKSIHAGMNVVRKWPLPGRFANFFSRVPGGSILARTICFVRYFKLQADLVIGVDIPGIIIAAHVARLKQLPCALFSYEILFASEVGKRRKAAEQLACRGIKFALVQDETRAALLSQENQIDLSKLIIMPIGSRGTRSPNPSWLRNKLQIPDNRKIALFMGSTQSWSGFQEVLADLADWPEEWALVVHNRYGFSQRQLQELSRNRPQNLYVSTAPFLSNEDLGDLLGDVDLGIAFYCPDFEDPYTGKNLEHIGMASGKIATFLRFGIPVIINRIGEMSHHVNENKLGLVIPSIKNLPQSLRLANSRSDDISKRCHDFFTQHLDVERTGDLLFARIDQICKADRVN